MTAVWRDAVGATHTGSHHARPLPETVRSRRPAWLTTSTRVIALNLNSASDRRERDLGLSGEPSF